MVCNHGDFQEAVSEVTERCKSLARTRNVDGKKFQGTFPCAKQCVCVLKFFEEGHSGFGALQCQLQERPNKKNQKHIEIYVKN